MDNEKPTENVDVVKDLSAEKESTNNTSNHCTQETPEKLNDLHLQTTSTSSSDSPSIRRRSSNSLRRTYRNTRSGNPSDKDENTSDEEPMEQSDNAACKVDIVTAEDNKGENKFSESVIAPSELSVDAPSEESVEIPTPESVEVPSPESIDISSPGSNPLSPDPLHDISSSSSSDDWDVHIPERTDDLPNLLSRLRGVRHNFGDYSTSSSSSDAFEDVEEENVSSSSSDLTLEDLDEPVKSDDNAPAAKKTKSSKSQEPVPAVLLKPKPKHQWNATKEILRRQLGYSGRVQPQAVEIFRSRFYGSLHSVERLELMHKLEGHTGCVNCLNFNYSGTKLASGSDDLQIKIWNYGYGKLNASFHSGHRANVFQAKFLPLVGVDNIIVSCARDNQVRLNELKPSGEVGASRLLAKHRGPVHKLAINYESPQTFLTAGEDGIIFSIDIREEQPQKIARVRQERNRKLSLYSINCNPFNVNEFCVTGQDQFVRIYDSRKLPHISVPVQQGFDETGDSTLNEVVPMKKFCPHRLTGSRLKPFVTAAMYSYNGAEIVASYSDENIFLFDSSHSDGADYIKEYEGHQNTATIKGVNFFGDRSQFIVSGSDCGHVFLWDKEKESIVNFFRGDENGVVNCLEPHPSFPILATSGLDDDVKIWISSNENPPKLGDLSSTVRRNIKKRREKAERDPNPLDGELLYAVWSQMRRTARQRQRVVGGDPSDATDALNLSDDSTGDEEDDDDDDGPAGNMDCVIS